MSQILNVLFCTNSLTTITMKNQRERLVVPVESIDNEAYNFIPTGIMLIRGTRGR